MEETRIGMPGPPWRKSSYSGANGCVEVQELDDRVTIRNSRDRNGPVLEFTSQEWRAFVKGVRDGEFGIPG